MRGGNGSCRERGGWSTAPTSASRPDSLVEGPTGGGADSRRWEGSLASWAGGVSLGGVWGGGGGGPPECHTVWREWRRKRCASTVLTTLYFRFNDE